eukprot:TRINITY_DN15022_c0_g1_i1.p1 TRINITY_DN15022_c0_g1~~TRINITY_DN15022_c0_g1_i1.p1  ORF type:complete len:363 (+),score=61.21 TRINITY_DN15022_c0_g1_i1:79-1167(+)
MMAPITSGLFAAGDLRFALGADDASSLKARAAGPGGAMAIGARRAVVPARSPGTASRSTSPGSSPASIAAAAADADGEGELGALLRRDASPMKVVLNLPSPPQLHAQKTLFHEMGRPPSFEGLLDERSVPSASASRGISFDDICCAPPGLEAYVGSLAGTDVPSGDSVLGSVTREPSSDEVGMPPGLESLLTSMDEFGADAALAEPCAFSWPPSAGCGGFVPGMDAVLAGLHATSVAAQMPLTSFSVGPLLLPPPPVQTAPAIALTLPPPPPSQAPGAFQVQIVAAPVLGSAALPTRGSMNHRNGTCRPCAFMHTKGCNNGVDCTFCHLCPPGERKLRKKERKTRIVKARSDAEVSQPLAPR